MLHGVSLDLNRMDAQKKKKKKHAAFSSRIDAQVPCTTLPFHKMEDAICNLFAPNSADSCFACAANNFLTLRSGAIWRL